MGRLERREFLKLGAIGVGSLCFTQLPSFACALPALPQDSPLKRISTFASEKFGGDEYRRPHDILWNLDTYISGKGGWPTVVHEDRDVVIIGGGLSGLVCAHELRDRDWTLVEQADQFGGNAKAEKFKENSFSLGPAYITIPEVGSAEEELIRDLGLSTQGRIEKADEARVLFGSIKNLWTGETEPAAAESAARVESALKQVYLHAFPDIPWREDGALTRAQLADLDRKTAAEWLLGFGPLHPHVLEYFQVYAWSAFCGSLDEISAAQFLNFAAAETAGVMAFPGGNAAIATALVEKLRGNEGRLRAGTLVLDVREIGGLVEVLIENEAGELRRLRAKSVIMAAPKYVAIRLMRHLVDAERIRLWKSITYRAYMVANVRLKSRVVAPAFDVFCLEGSAPSRPTFGHRTDRDCTDFIFANWAANGRDEGAQGETILTVYRPFPLEGARNVLMGPTLHERMQKDFRKEMEIWLKQLGLPEDSILDLRLSLWGHSVPLAKVGRFADGSLDQICAPIGSRIFFANQDDSMNPAFESCLASARRAATSVRSV